MLLALPFATPGCARGGANERPDATAGVDAAGAAPDVAVDGTQPDAQLGCAISAGFTPVLDGTDDLLAYPSSQRLVPAAAVGSGDAIAIGWNATNVFITASSTAFVAPYEPLHVYVQAGTSLGAAALATGKEYSGLVPDLPFAATQLIAIRRVSDAGTGAYNGVFVPSDAWSARIAPLDAIASADQRTLSVAVPWTVLGGCPTTLRLALHVVHAQAGNEWKDLVPSTHAPWVGTSGGFYEIDLTAPPAISGWTLR